MTAFDAIQDILAQKEHKRVDLLSPVGARLHLFDGLHFWEPVFRTAGRFRMLLNVPPGTPDVDIDLHYELLGNLGWRIRSYSSRALDAFVIVDCKHLLLAHTVDLANGEVDFTLGDARGLADCTLHFERLWETVPFRAVAELMSSPGALSVLYDWVVPPADPELATRLATLSTGRWDQIIRELAQDSNRLHSLTPRRFEELVAELLTREGFDVHLTPTARDGGFDIMAALETHLGRILYMVECKRYGQARPVSVGIVRGLYGVVEAREASAGVVVTTSRFTGPALDFATQRCNRIALRDYDPAETPLGVEGRYAAGNASAF